MQMNGAPMPCRRRAIFRWRSEQIAEAEAIAKARAELKALEPKPRLSCPECDYQTASAHGLKIHKAKAHGNPR